MKAPRLWRKKRGGKYYGDWIVTIKGEEVRLGTKNAKIAHERLPAALKGKRDFESDAAAAATASEPDVEELGGPDTGRVAEGTIPIGPPSSSPPVIIPELLPPPAPADPPPSSSADAQAEADATNAAAAETAGAGGGSANDNAQAFTLPPDVIKDLLLQGAMGIVEAQLQLQAWIIKKRFGLIASPVAYEGAGKSMRDAASQAWVAQLEKWFPDIESCPPWLIAVGAPLILLPAQLHGATLDPDKKAEKSADPAPAQAAA